MNGELRLADIGIPVGPRQHRFFWAAILMSLTLHVAGFLTSPYWQSLPSSAENIVQVDLADIPQHEMPKVPNPPVLPPAPRVAPRPPVAEQGRMPAEPPPPTREMVRAKVASRGLLKALSSPGANDAGGDPLSGIKIPKEIRVSSRATPNSYPVARDDEPGTGTGKVPGIAKHLASVSKSPKILSSQIFRTDAGLEGSISGGIDDENRTVGAISARISQYHSGIKWAYNKELLKNPNLGGKITVAFVILPNGSVESASVRQSSVNWPPLEDAVIKRMSHWTFPRSKGASVQVIFPFVFHPEM